MRCSHRVHGLADVTANCVLLRLVSERGKRRSVDECYRECNARVWSTEWADHSNMHGQADINEVNKTAHTIKARLEALDNANKKAITQPVSRVLIPAAQSNIWQE